MTARDFCFWLQGFFELQGPVVEMNEEQINMVRRHLGMVFLHDIDPAINAKVGPEVALMLDAIHAGRPVHGILSGGAALDTLHGVRLKC